jgi:iron complex transport system permease protein
VTVAGEISSRYAAYVRRKLLVVLALSASTGLALVVAISLGSADLPLSMVAKALIGIEVPRRVEMIVWGIRLPQALAAIAAGAGLAVAGAATQSILRNPLASPFTLGMSHAAAFGAALSVTLLSSGTMASSSVGAIMITNPHLTTATAFVFCVLAAMTVVAVSRLRGTTPEVMVLTGVALSALFTAGTMFLQYFADDTQLAAMVFWTFGDTARASWPQVGIMAAVAALASAYFVASAWAYNAIDSGDETAKGLGVRVERLRMAGMLVASLVTATIIAFLGIIGFVGLVVPHLVRRTIGADHRYLLPATVVAGALLLLVADTAARLAFMPHVLPVSVLTAFVGAPVFLWLIVKGRR